MSFSLSCCTVSGLNVADAGDGSFTIGSVACQRHGHLDSLTTNFISPCGLLMLRRSRFDAFHDHVFRN